MTDIPKLVYIWTPEISRSKGGIQEYCAHLCSATRSAVCDNAISVFVKNDLPDPNDRSVITCGQYPSLLRTLIFIVKIVSSALRRRPSLVVVTHLHFAPIAYWLCKMVNIPYWVVLYGIESWYSSSNVKERALSSARCVLAISKFTRDNSAVRMEPCELLPCSFNQDCFSLGPYPKSLKARHKIPERSSIILTVARLAATERYKGHDQVIKCLQNILNTTYIIVGDGDDRPRLEQLAADVGVAERVIFAGKVSDEELPDYYRLCDIFVMPSKGEGFGIVYLEAMGCGKPCIAGNCDGSRDPLMDGELGLLVDPDNLDEITEGILSILEKRCNPNWLNPEWLHEQVVKNFGTEAFNARVAEIIEKRAPWNV